MPIRERIKQQLATEKETERYCKLKQECKILMYTNGLLYLQIIR